MKHEKTQTLLFADICYSTSLAYTCTLLVHTVVTVPVTAVTRLLNISQCRYGLTISMKNEKTQTAVTHPLDAALHPFHTVFTVTMTAITHLLNISQCRYDLTISMKNEKTQT